MTENLLKVNINFQYFDIICDFYTICWINNFCINMLKTVKKTYILLLVKNE